MNRILEWFQAETGSTPTDDRQSIRERILTVGLIGAAVLGLVAYYVNVRTAIQQDLWGWVVVYTLALAWVCLIAFIRRIPYVFRAVSMLVILYILGVISALQYGAAGDSRIWLIGTVVLASIFLGFRAGLTSTVVTTATYLGIGWLMTEEIINVPDPSIMLVPNNPDGWLTTSVVFFIISILVVSALGVLVNGLNNSIKQNRDLANELATDQKQLETRTQALERRELQIRTAAEISRAAIAELDPTTLFQRVVDLVQSRFQLYYVGVFVVDRTGHYAVLRAGTGEAGKRMLERNHRLAIGSTSMIGYAISNREARIASDVGYEAHRFDNPDLPLTRSELALPMISAGQVLGAMTVQSTESNAFDEDDIIVLQGVADSLSTALENANLFQQVQASLEEVQTLHRQYLLESWSNVASRAQGIKYTYKSEFDTTEGAPTNQLPPTNLEVPLVLRDQVIGNLMVEANRSALTPEEQAFIDTVTQQTALALENIRLVEETQRTAQQDRVISEISEDLSRAMDVDSALKTTVQALGRLPNVAEVSVHIHSEDTD